MITKRADMGYVCLSGLCFLIWWVYQKHYTISSDKHRILQGKEDPCLQEANQKKAGWKGRGRENDLFEIEAELEGCARAQYEINNPYFKLNCATLVQ